MPRMTWIFQQRCGTPKRTPILIKIHMITIETKPHHMANEQICIIKIKGPLGISRTLIHMI